MSSGSLQQALNPMQGGGPPAPLPPSPANPAGGFGKGGGLPGSLPGGLAGGMLPQAGMPGGNPWASLIQQALRHPAPPTSPLPPMPQPARRSIVPSYYLR